MRDVRSFCAKPDDRSCLDSSELTDRRSAAACHC